MIKKLLFLAGCFLIVFPCSFAFSESQEKIKSFVAEIEIKESGELLIKEKIVYDFGTLSRHGIFRNLPLDGLEEIKIIKVEDEFGNPYKFTISKERNYLKLKIGDPEKEVTGQKTYVIFYKVFGSLGYFENHDELYWNVTGNEWSIPIEKSEALIYLPKKISEKDLKLDCFTGYFGSKEKDCSFFTTKEGNIRFKAKRTLNPKEGLTIVLGWPKGIVRQPSFFQKFLFLFKNFWPILMPVFVFFYLLREWWYKGKDPKIKQPIVVEYEPPENLRPAEISLVLNQEVNQEDLSATILDLAVKGFVKIKEIKEKIFGLFEEKDYELVKIKDFKDQKEDLRGYERKLLEKIFENKEKVSISELKNRFYFEVEAILDSVYSEISSLNYFFGNPKKVVNRWRNLGLVIIFSSLFCPFVFQNNLVPFFSFLSSGILFLIFAPFMPKRTKKGVEIYQKILGFKEYISSAEKYRVQFYERENIFEKYLPYALVFGLAEKWAKAFEGIYTTPPSWYEGEWKGGFSTSSLLHSVNQSLLKIDQTFSPNVAKTKKISGFGRGGFAGGGRGGGGGGSW